MPIQMTPTEFGAWVTAIVTGLTAITIGLAKTAEVLGLRPQDRRQRYAQRLQECEIELEKVREELQEERQNVYFMERLLTRQGWRKTDKGWEEVK